LMGGKVIFVCFMAWFLLPMLIPTDARAQSLAGRVIGVSDGDTITFLDANKTQHKIRLSGIDAPESGQAFGDRSKKSLSDCAFGKTAIVDGNKTDRYGRTVAKVVVNGTDCNLRQIELGVAWHFKKYESEQPVAERSSYAAAEVVARQAKRGLWADARASAEPPWEWRTKKTAGAGEPPAVPQSTYGARPTAEQSCSCSSDVLCTGTKGGTYCITDSGRRKYVK
jgi:endonuclease YncB( thermonuclease family)